MHNDAHDSDAIGYYLLDKATGTVHRVTDDGSDTRLVIQWARQLTDDMRTIARDTVDRYEIGTSFMGIDLSHVTTWPPPTRPAGYRPLVFETIAIHAAGRDSTVVWMRRARTLDEAKASHVEAVRRARAHQFDQERAQ